MINAYGEGIPGNGRRFAQGAMVERLMGPRKELQVVVPCGGAGHSKIGAPTATGCCGEQCWGASRVFWVNVENAEEVSWQLQRSQ